MHRQLAHDIRHWIATGLGVATVLVGLCYTPHAAAQEIWFAPWAPPGGPKDYMNLFQPNAPWQRAAAAVKVFALPFELANPVPGVNVSQIFADLRRRNIDLALGMAPLSGGGPGGSGGPGKCGYNVEGYGASGGPYADALHFKALGADPRYYAMDEPLFFGHVFNRDGGRVGCRSSIADLARDVASKVRQVRSVFPNVRFGDVEPLTFQDNDPWLRSGAWLADLSAWFDAFQAATGDKLAFFCVDAWWTPGLSEHMPALAQLLRTKGIPLQIIYDGNGQDKTDKAWIASAVSHFKLFESGNWPLPAAAVFEMWTPNPSRILPETDPLTATGLIDQYLNWQQTRPRRSGG